MLVLRIPTTGQINTRGQSVARASLDVIWTFATQLVDWRPIHNHWPVHFNIQPTDPNLVLMINHDIGTLREMHVT